MNTLDKYKELSDDELIEQIRKTNNSIFFELLYDRYSEVVFNKCIGFCKNADEAKDLAQDVFLKVYIKLSSFQGNSKFSTWLYSLTYNHCVNYVNRDTEKKIEKQSIQLDDYDNLLIEVDDNSLFQLQVHKLKQALALITPSDKMLLLLKYQDDASIKDIAALMDLGESAVKMRIKRAKARVVELCNKF